MLTNVHIKSNIVVACVQTSPISFVARNKGNRRRLHAGKHRRGFSISHGRIWRLAECTPPSPTPLM